MNRRPGAAAAHQAECCAWRQTAGGKIITSFAMLLGVLFMAMPITIVGNNFATVWEEKESVSIVLTVQRLFAARNLSVSDVVKVTPYRQLVAAVPSCGAHRWRAA